MDLEYEREARKLLTDEYVCFSEADILRVFEKYNRSYSNTWRILNESECEGIKATCPLEDLRPPRPNEVQLVDIRIDSLSSSALRDELGQLLKSWHKSRREYSQWASGLFFSEDQDGKEQLLDADGRQVMMEWERPYMERCIDVLRMDQDSDVLEIGFGCAYSAEQIQSKGPRSHTIVECSPPVLERLRKWASTRPNVKVVEGTWQEKLPELGVFDCVFFDDYGAPGVADREMEDTCPDPAYRAEYAKALEAKGGTHFHGFLNLVTQWHARVGTRMSGYLHYPVDMQRNDLEAIYQHMDIVVPDHCNYFPTTSQQIWPFALVPLFIKRDEGFMCDDQEDTTAGSQDSESKSDSPSPSRSQSCDQARSRSRSRSRSNKRRDDRESSRQLDI